MTVMDIVHALVEARKRKGISPTGMAERLRIAKSTLRLYESGERPMPIGVAERYAEELKGQILFIPKDMDI